MSSLPRAFRSGRQASPAQRLAAVLQPERSCEEDFLESIADLPGLDLLADMVERADKRTFLDSAEVGRREVEQEHADAGCPVNSKGPG